jgi:hypothetical protein
MPSGIYPGVEDHLNNSALGRLDALLSEETNYRRKRKLEQINEIFGIFDCSVELLNEMGEGVVSS